MRNQLISLFIIALTLLRTDSAQGGRLPDWCTCLNEVKSVVLMTDLETEINSLASYCEREGAKQLALGIKPIYGKDDRVEEYCLSDSTCTKQKLPHLTDTRIEAAKRASNAVAILSEKSRLLKCSTGYWLRESAYRVPTDQGVKEVCPKNKFGEQRTAGFCTGFLVNRKVIATADHCLKGQTINTDAPEKNTFRLLLGYNRLAEFPVSGSSINRKFFTKDQVFNVKSVIQHGLKSNPALDFAFLEVDVSDKTSVPEPFKLPEKGKHTLKSTTEFVMIGHPWGLSKKLDLGKDHRIVEERSKTVRIQLDAFGGNSGSPVTFLDEPERVAGILTHGLQDFEAGANDCANYVEIDELDDASEKKGETVLKMSTILENANKVFKDLVKN